MTRGWLKWYSTYLAHACSWVHFQILFLMALLSFITFIYMKLVNQYIITITALKLQISYNSFIYLVLKLVLFWYSSYLYVDTSFSLFCWIILTCIPRLVREFPNGLFSWDIFHFFFILDNNFIRYIIPICLLL
jgi:hypothetical protein